MKFNPFVPGSMCYPGMLAGRLDEIAEFDRALFQTKNGNPWHFLIHGERGIGKSSLMLVCDAIAKGNFPGWESGETYNFVSVNVEIEPATTYPQLVSLIGSSVAKKLGKIEYVKSAGTGVWDWITNWEVLGVKYNKDCASNPTGSIQDLSENLALSCDRLKGHIDGFLILIDEADNATGRTQLGEFVKVFTERLTKDGCGKVALGISGLSKVIETMRADHQSSPRVMKHMLLEPLLHDERIDALRRGIEHANERSPEQITMTQTAETWIAHYSEGYPNFIQQYAFSAFEVDNDNTIDDSDAIHGAFKENGALDQLAEQYFKVMYHEQVNSEVHRKILQMMAASPDKFIARKEIQTATGIKQSTLTQALKSLSDKEIILSHPSKQGFYRLPTDSFALWIRTTAEKEQRQSDQKSL